MATAFSHVIFDLDGTILNTLGTQFHIGFLTAQIGEKVPYTIGGLTSFMLSLMHI